MKLIKDERTLQEVAQLIAYAFRKSEPLVSDPLFLSRYDHADCYGNYQENQLANVVMANPFKGRLYDETVKMAGIGYVASYPEFRGRGDIRKLMVEILTDLYQNGTLLAQLAPFSERFYRQFGYEHTSRQKNYRIPAAAFDFLTDEKTGTIKRGSWETLKLPVLSIYQTSLKEQQVGTMVREGWWWQRLEAYYPGRFYAVAYDDQQQPQGYVSYRMLEKEKTLFIDEMAYLNGFGLRKMLTFLKAHTSSFEVFVYRAPLHERLEECFSEQEMLEISQKPYMMSRIIDFPQVLLKLPLQSDGILVEVTKDDVCAWNEGKWLVANGRCQRVFGREADIKGSIQAWTQVLIGGLSLEESVRLDQLQVGNDPAVFRLFPKGKQNFYDYF